MMVLVVSTSKVVSNNTPSVDIERWKDGFLAVQQGLYNWCNDSCGLEKGVQSSDLLA